MDRPVSKTTKSPIRTKTLERVISKAGLGSRTDARTWVHERRVKVNGQIVENPDEWIDPLQDRIELDGRRVKTLDKIYILLYKPAGYITSNGDPEGRPTVYDLIKDVPTFVGTVGRLDEDTSGLLLFTNDTLLAEGMTNPHFHVSKTYLVKCATKLSDGELEQLRSGIELRDGMTRPAVVKRVRENESKTFIELTITQGRNRQVRRMIEALESKVLKLVRTKIGPLTLDGLESGKWRNLNPGEVAKLYKIAKLDEKVEAEKKASRQVDKPQGRAFDRPQGRSSDRPQGRPFDKPQGWQAERPQSRTFDKPQGRSFDKPQDRSFDKPQSRPSDRPQGRPFDKPRGWQADRPQGRPFDKPPASQSDRPQGRSFDRPQGRPSDRPQGRPFDKPQGWQSDRPQGRPFDKPQDRRPAPANRSSFARDFRGGGSGRPGGRKNT